MPVTFFFVGHELEHAQKLWIFAKMQKDLKTPTKVDCTAKMSIADLFKVEF